MINLESNLFMVAEALALVLLTGCSKSEKPHCAISFALSPAMKIHSPRLLPFPSNPWCEG